MELGGAKLPRGSALVGKRLILPAAPGVRSRMRLSADERECGEKQTAIWPFAQETSAYTLRLNQSVPQRNAGQMQTADFNAVSSSQRGPASSASATSAG
ncbi:hypothetical protein MHYP_G00063690 [Metynnis hypsauchen]